MNTLIVPCAINRIIGGEPLGVKRHPLGRLVVHQCFYNLDLGRFDSIIIALNQKEEAAYGIREKICKELQDYDKVKVTILDEETSGPAETVYQTIAKENVTGSLVLKDSTNYIDISEDMYGKNFIAGINISSWPEDIHDIRRKSFIKVNEQAKVLDIIEKKVKSEIIGAGLYGFKDAKDYCEAYEKLNNSVHPLRSLYVSHIISYLIGVYGKVFHYLPVTEFEDWSSEKCWLDIQARYANYFLDLDAIFGVELDCQSHLDVIEDLTKLSAKGATFIGFTSNDESVKKRMKNMFLKRGINCIQVVYGCSMSKIKRIISTDTMVRESNYKL